MVTASEWDVTRATNTRFEYIFTLLEGKDLGSGSSFNTFVHASLAASGW